MQLKVLRNTPAALWAACLLFFILLSGCRPQQTVMAPSRLLTAQAAPVPTPAQPDTFSQNPTASFPTPTIGTPAGKPLAAKTFPARTLRIHHLRESISRNMPATHLKEKWLPQANAQVRSLKKNWAEGDLIKRCCMGLGVMLGIILLAALVTVVIEDDGAIMLLGVVIAVVIGIILAFGGNSSGDTDEPTPGEEKPNNNPEASTPQPAPKPTKPVVPFRQRPGARTAGVLMIVSLMGFMAAASLAMALPTLYFMSFVGVALALGFVALALAIVFAIGALASA